jgi:microfibrillar-associated protein 1
MSTVLATQVRKHTARPARAAGRYWKGKAPKGAAELPSDSEDDEEQNVPEEGDVQIGGEQDIVEEEDEDESIPTRAAQVKATRAINVSLKDVSISQDGKVIVAGREESGRTVLEEGMSCQDFNSSSFHLKRIT